MKKENIERANDIIKTLERLEKNIEFLEYFKSDEAKKKGVSGGHKIEIEFNGAGISGHRRFSVESNNLIDSFIVTYKLKEYREKVKTLNKELETL